MAPLLLALSGLAACSSDDEEASPSDPPASSWAEQSSDAQVAADVPPEFSEAVSEPVEDANYPDVGEPIVDALHYDLDLTWDRDAGVLRGAETITFRATEDADEVQFDLGEALQVSELSVDGAKADFRKDGKDLVIEQPVRADAVHEVELRYEGAAEPVPAPTTRSDMQGIGLTVADDGSVWTMQEPYGAFTWYAVNDQPADKALYDFTLSVAAPWTGVANGELVDTRERDGMRVTRFHLAEPASSYLTTVAFGDYVHTEDEPVDGTPISYWTPRDQPEALTAMRKTPEALRWLIDLLGPYPFDTLGAVVVDSESAMETQTLMTMGDTSYTLSTPTLVHEIAHQWYGNTVSPKDWRDVWLNEGMTMYIQAMWEAREEGTDVSAVIDSWAGFEAQARTESGPPADYDPEQFGTINIYYGPAVMFQSLREEIGDEKFFALMREWPEANENGNADYEDFVGFLVDRSGVDREFFDSWLRGDTSPSR